MEAELLCYGIGKTPKNKWILISISSQKKDKMIKDGYTENQLLKWGCLDWISLIFDDITKTNYDKIKETYPHSNKMNNIKLFSKKDAKLIINFIKKYKDNKEKLTLIIHCQAGISRSGAIGWFSCKFLELNKSKFLQQNQHLYPNRYILYMLESLYKIDLTDEDEYFNIFRMSFN